MTELPKPSETAFPPDPVSARILRLQFVQAAIGLGAVAFALVVLALHAAGIRSGQPDGAKLMQLLSRITVVVLCVTYLPAWRLPPLIAKAFHPPVRNGSAAAREAQTEAEAFDDFLARFFVARLARLLLLDAAATYGLAVCLIGSLGDVIVRRPEHWFNVLPAAVLLCYVLATFPTRGRLEGRFRSERTGRSTRRLLMDSLETRRMP